MNSKQPAFLEAKGLATLAQSASTSPCARCAPLVCTGWESLPATFEQSQLVSVGSLCDEKIEEPSLTEYHPQGTNGWSADAPIAPAYFPYNRCTVWACTQCARVYLRYTEYGGYYIDERIRAVNPTLIVDDAPAIDLAR